MKKILAALILSLAAAPALSQKPCEELKSEIVDKLETKGVKNYHLEVVAANQVKDQKVIGSCEGGRKKITYSRDSGIQATQAGPIRHPPPPPPLPPPDHGGKPPIKPPKTPPGHPGPNSPLPPKKPGPSHN